MCSWCEQKLAPASPATWAGFTAFGAPEYKPKPKPKLKKGKK